MAVTYYSIHRPIGPGTFPKVNGIKILEIRNYDYRQYVNDIGREAWGYIVYDAPISEAEARQYELIKGGMANDAL